MNWFFRVLIFGVVGLSIRIVDMVVVSEKFIVNNEKLMIIEKFVISLLYLEGNLE